ncbi:MAG: penicillin-binding protein 1B [Thermodesulfobacteriota bacterium]
MKWGILAALVLFVLLAFYLTYLDQTIREKFEGKRWSLPAVVYARPLELSPGMRLTTRELEGELQLLDYRKERKAVDAGGYDQRGRTVHLVTRGFRFPDGMTESAAYTLTFSGNTLARITRTDTDEPVDSVRLDPARIGSFHPNQHEDRILLSRNELPELLVNTLLAVEDQNFRYHPGIDPLAVVRALIANARAQKTVQGGSTLTQQLVKNLFLTNERTFGRKINEAFMALLLEAHYSKDEILTAYANEIFLGQDGNRAIHGFGLASHFYFRKELNDLSPEQIATLVGMIRGPSYYDPRQEPKRCLKRRQDVLAIMRDQEVLSEEEYRRAKAAPLAIQPVAGSSRNRFPAFLDLVRRQLAEEYREEALTTEGLKIFTTLDPRVQMVVEERLARTVGWMARARGMNDLEGAVVVTRRESGEILAMAGGRTPGLAGFNRALDARRNVGSVIKPAVYLTALAKGYTLASPVDDTAITVPSEGGVPWQPMNFDRSQHGRIPLYRGLVLSLNLATTRLGMEVGVKNVAQTMRDLGVQAELPTSPAVLLGAASLTPLEVAQMYQTFATGGYYVPQRAISSVLAADDRVAKRFTSSTRQRFAPEEVYLLNTALQKVVREGTGAPLANYLPSSHNVAGKTGTSNDLRDSWFAGFTGDLLAVVWLGRDNNKPAGMTGGQGALVVWGEIMRELRPQPLELVAPEGIEWRWVKLRTQETSATPFWFANQAKLPFTAASLANEPKPPEKEKNKKEPAGTSAGRVLQKILDWFR